MKKAIIKKVNATMVAQLINFENYKINALAQMTEFVNKSSIPNKEEVIEQYKQMFNEQEDEPIVLGGKYNQYFLKYDKSTRVISIEDESEDEEDKTINWTLVMDFDYNTFIDIACFLTESIKEYIEEYYEDEIVEDCGEYWEIKE